ncbi:MAG: zinc ribbon domain-containing protein [Ruminococcus sp.]|jgi:ribosomal protein L40E|nr:zinc ribbon domain-containing protein [Ruminococcus sp.]
MKSKLGVSVGMIAGIAYFLGLVSGYIPLLLILGYVLIAEENRWLKVSVVKAVIVCLAFSLIQVLIGLIPELFSIINVIASLFDEYVNFAKVTSVFSTLGLLVSFAEKIVLLILGFMAFKQKSFSIDAVDSLISRHFPLRQNEDIVVAKTCPSCGAKLSADADVCSTCGNKV